MVFILLMVLSEYLYKYINRDIFPLSSYSIRQRSYNESDIHPQAACLDTQVLMVPDSWFDIGHTVSHARSRFSMHGPYCGADGWQCLA